MCTKCHDDLNKLIAITDYGHEITPHHSHLGDLTCSECHKMHNKSVASCQNCHDFEFLQKLPPQWRKLQVGDLKTMLENTGGK
ncbi:MAG: cytochrome c3 family protein, partial [Campylobacter sp.]|nr:cytochrome c3 family protein [Campylobacter sp.]